MCKQSVRQSHSGTDHPFSASTGLGVVRLHSCREDHWQTIVPLRYIRPAVHTPAAPSPWWNVTLIHLSASLRCLGTKCDAAVAGQRRLGVAARPARLRRWDGTSEAAFCYCSRLLKPFTCCLPKHVISQMTLWISSEHCSIKSDNEG